MYKGIIYALAACFVWGLIFVVPMFMTGYTPVEVAMGRYVTYGALSLLIFFKSRCRYPKAIWIKATLYSFVYTMGYYLCVILSVRLSTPAICALILGLSPIAIAFYGNWKEKEISNKSLIVPSLLTLLGLIIINIPGMQSANSTTTYLWGLFFGTLALIGWSWYVVANSHFLKKHPHVDSSEWATLIGVTCLVWVALFGLFFGLFLPEQFSVQKCLSLSPDFVIGSLVLGVVSAWLGYYFWNKASLNLPVSFAGQLTIFETIFGVIFFYAIEMKMPPLLECIGILLFLGAIIYGVSQFSTISMRKKTI